MLNLYEAIKVISLNLTRLIYEKGGRRFFSNYKNLNTKRNHLSIAQGNNTQGFLSITLIQNTNDYHLEIIF